ncbi:unnamed protein product, partial [Heterotrigona itama]
GDKMRGNWEGASTSDQQEQQDIVEKQEPHHLPTTPAWDSVDKIVKEEPIEDKNNDSGISPDHYTNNSASPRSRTTSSSTANCSLSSESATSHDWNGMQNNTFECNSQNGDLITFAEHLTTHYAAKFEVSDFVKSVFNQLSVQDENRTSPNQGERSEQESEETDEQGLRVPRLNSQGKVKTFRCKQCNFVAITKLEFWDHSRSHIKAEKLLTCPKCPFVTEYKHHLEYHLRNHFGSKPFKCDKCSYSCVNKSMLNSHLKSHSNIYQYRCANCSYATKYCHSLKLHLRKYSHDPAMVLNADGSPNPLPIIDVYGTRRGPKPKSQAKSQEDATQSNQSTTEDNSTQAPVTSSQLSPSEVTSPSPVNHHLPSYPVNGIDVVSSGIAPINGLSGLMQNQSMMAFSYSQLLPKLTFKPFITTEDNNIDKQLDHIRSNVLMEYFRTMDEESMPEDAPQNLVVRCPNGDNVPSNSSITEEISDNTVQKEVEPFLGATSCLPDVAESMDFKYEPLDLSKSNNANVEKSPAKQKTGTSRRKGKAVKLDQRVLEEDTTDDEQQEELQQSFGEQQQSFQTLTANKECNFGMNHEFTCQYCDIIFGNVVMYTVHMGYHGYKDPFTCNMCGHQSIDKVSFFLHIARSKHS